ncbi:MAG: hypothetical protein DRQ48_00810 [Gammaproteobacteria bacterium]|nr:MAG: hypothetical protein DRQ44_00560 [Gammaproteobacteria bacterium]RKZ72219.1 MAG: hypothetical protein DRQ48_00810 [Gammaproteobacteria bacterium]
MVYPVLKVITNAYYKSGIASRDFSTVSGSQEAVGLDSLNKLFADKTVQEYLVPYYTEHQFNAVAAQEKYFIENLIDVDTAVFFLDSVRYAMNRLKRRRYFGGPRAENITSLPYSYHLEQELGGASIYLYFLPQQNYPITLWGKFRLGSVDFNDDLELTTELFYIDFIEFELARRLCVEYNFTIPDGVESELKRFYATMSKSMAPLDLSVQKLSTLQKRRQGDLYQDANLGKGWRP